MSGCEDFKGPAERRFCWLLTQRGCVRGRSFWYEEEIGEEIKLAKPRPDFLIHTRYGRVLAEVKSIEEPGPIERKRGQPGAFAGKECNQRLRNIVERAADQLSPYRSLGIPCIVIIDNWRRKLIGTGFEDLRWIWGEPEFHIKQDPMTLKVQSTELHQRIGRGEAALTKGKNTHISAVVVNRPIESDVDDYDMRSELLMRVRVAHNVYSDYPLPMCIFRHQVDEHACFP